MILPGARTDFLAEYDAAVTFDGAHGVTFRLYGKVYPEIVGHETASIENLDVYLGDADVTASLPESLMQAFTNAILEEYK